MRRSENADFNVHLEGDEVCEASPLTLKRMNRYRPKAVFGKGVGNSQNASEMRQKCVKNASEIRQNGSCFIGKRGTSKMRQVRQNASKMRHKCAEHLWGRTPFGRYRMKERDMTLDGPIRANRPDARCGSPGHLRT